MKFWLKIVLVFLITFSFLLIGTGFLIKEHQFYVINKSDTTVELHYKLSGSKKNILKIADGDSVKVCNVKKIFQRNAFNSSQNVFEVFIFYNKEGNKVVYDRKIKTEKKIIKYYYLIM